MLQGNGWDRLIEAYESDRDKNKDREIEMIRNEELVLAKLDEIKKTTDEIHDFLWKGRLR